MRVLFMGSIPTYQRSENRDINEQEKTFTFACEELGYAAAELGHEILVSDSHHASVDYHIIKGVIKYVTQDASRKAYIEIHRSEGCDSIYADLPSNIQVARKYHPCVDSVMKGGLISNLAALESTDILVQIGGRLTVRLMGQIAADKEKPVLAIPAFGGSAAEVFETLKWAHKGILGDHFSELMSLKSTWGPGSASRTMRLIDSLALTGQQSSPHSYFISYTWAESSIADHVEVLLHRHKRLVHRDESIFSAGADLSDVVRSLIDESDTFISLWSSSYKKSTWCPQEMEYAINRQAKGLKPSRVVLITLDETEPPIRFINRLWQAGHDRANRDLTVRRLLEQEK